MLKMVIGEGHVRKEFQIGGELVRTGENFGTQKSKRQYGNPIH